MLQISSSSTQVECFFNSLLHPLKSAMPYASFVAQCHLEWWCRCISTSRTSYVLEGSLQVYRSNEGASGGVNAGVGDAIIIPGNVKHALRNSSTVPVTLALVTKSDLYSFFRELARPFDPNQPAATVTPEAMQQLFEVAAKYGYWLASPAENAAIGLNIV
jgi:hypothetical protein